MYSSASANLFFTDSCKFVVLFIGVRCDRFEDGADILRQRLVQALVAPLTLEGGQKSDEQRNAHTEGTSRKPPSTDTLHLMDVAQLSLAQRVLVQLNGVGVYAVGARWVFARATTSTAVALLGKKPTPFQWSGTS